MKPGVTDHPKFDHLRQLIGGPKFAIAGVLELLWYQTAKWQEDGAIGRWPNGRIAAAIGWENDADALIDALVEAGWLDRVDDDRRLVVHDWEEHRPNYVDDKLRKRKERERRRAEKRSEEKDFERLSADSPGQSRDRRTQPSATLCSDDDDDARPREAEPEPSFADACRDSLTAAGVPVDDPVPPDPDDCVVSLDVTPPKPKEPPADLRSADVKRLIETAGIEHLHCSAKHREAARALLAIADVDSCALAVREAAERQKAAERGEGRRIGDVFAYAGTLLREEVKQAKRAPPAPSRQEQRKNRPRVQLDSA